MEGPNYRDDVLKVIHYLVKDDLTANAVLAKGCALIEFFDAEYQNPNRTPYELPYYLYLIPEDEPDRDKWEEEETWQYDYEADVYNYDLEERKVMKRVIVDRVNPSYALNILVQLLPWSIADTVRFRPLYDCILKSRGDELGGLVHLLQCYESCCRKIEEFSGRYEDIPVELKEKLIYSWQNCDEILDIEETMPRWWNSIVWSALPPVHVRGMAAIQRALTYYKERRLPKQLLLYDYSLVISREENREVLNPWQTLYRAVGRPVESGLTAHETAFNFAAMDLRDQRPTDVVLTTFYSSVRNDFALERWETRNFCLQRTGQYKPLIINPSPDTLLYCCENSWSADFVVRDKTLRTIYRRQFPQSEFYALTEFENAVYHGYYDILLLARDMPQSELDSVLKQLTEMPVNYICQLELLLPCAYLDAEEEKGYLKQLSTAFSLQHILLLPSEASKVSPKKKVVMRLDHHRPGKGSDLVWLYEAVCAENGACLWVDPWHYEVALEELLEGKSTLKALVKQKKHPQPTAERQRHTAEQLAFSKEITLRYSLLPNYHGKMAARAYYCASTYGQPGKRTKGKCLSERIEKGLRGRTREEVLHLLALLPLNHTELAGIIIRDIQSAYGADMEKTTLKTMWFCCRNELLLRSSYDDTMARRLFCGEDQTLADLKPDTALERDYSAAMEHVLGEPQLQHWQQLDKIMDAAERAGYLRRNRVHEMMSSLSEQLSSRAQNVRSNLVKKVFSRREEKKILAYFREKTEMYVKKRRARRYEAEPLALAAAIRFYTGMRASEVCALRWSDLDRTRFPDEMVYQLRVERFAREDGSICSHIAREDWRRYRIVPVVPELAEMIEARRAFLMRQKGNEERPLDGRYMFPRRGRPGEHPAPCRPQDIRDACSKLLTYVDIPQLYVELPEESGVVETDINHYRGDMFRAHFAARATMLCGLTGGELAYVMGRAAPDTFSENYCDFSNGNAQLMLLHKLRRWSSPLAMNAHTTVRSKTGWIQRRSTIEQVKPMKDGAAVLEMTLEAGPEYAGGQVMIEVEHITGFQGDIVFIEGAD